MALAVAQNAVYKYYVLIHQGLVWRHMVYIVLTVRTPSTDQKGNNNILYTLPTCMDMQLAG